MPTEALILIELLGKMSIPGAAAIIGYFVLRPLAEAWGDKIKSKISKNHVQPKHESQLSEIDRQIKLISSNHFHDMEDGLRAIVENQKVEIELLRGVKDDLTYVKARIENHNHA